MSDDNNPFKRDVKPNANAKADAEKVEYDAQGRRIIRRFPGGYEIEQTPTGRVARGSRFLETHGNNELNSRPSSSRMHRSRYMQDM
jgi:hypothetical protein